MRDFDGRGVGGLGAADRTGPAAWQDATEGIAADNLGDLLAAPERRAVAQHPGRIRSVGAGGAPLHSLGEAGRLGAAARSRPAARHHAWHDLSRRHQHPGSPQGGGRTKKGVDSRQRDEREALGRSRGGYGTKACVIADERGGAIAFAPVYRELIEEVALDMLAGRCGDPERVAQDPRFAIAIYRAAIDSGILNNVTDE